jgi:hypothetical protein
MDGNYKASLKKVKVPVWVPVSPVPKCRVKLQCGAVLKIRGLG